MDFKIFLLISLLIVVAIKRSQLVEVDANFDIYFFI